jgi:hypothetical protein
MASIIDRTLAKKLISAYQAKNAAAGGPALKTPDGKFLNGFFIDRASIEAMLNCSPDIEGISLHIAVNPDFINDGSENIFTIIFAGAEPNPDFTKTNGAPQYFSKYDVFDQVSPCPPTCSAL